MKISNPVEWDGTVFHTRASKNIWYVLFLKEDTFVCWIISKKTSFGGSEHSRENIEYNFNSGEWIKLFNMSDVVREAQDGI